MGLEHREQSGPVPVSNGKDPFELCSTGVYDPQRRFLAYPAAAGVGYTPSTDDHAKPGEPARVLIGSRLLGGATAAHAVSAHLAPNSRAFIPRHA